MLDPSTKELLFYMKLRETNTWKSKDWFTFKDKYDKSAVKVSETKESGGGGPGERFRRGASPGPAKLPVSKRSLVYIQPSPDYCSDDPQVINNLSMKDYIWKGCILNAIYNISDLIPRSQKLSQVFNQHGHNWLTESTIKTERDWSGFFLREERVVSNASI